jgi:hypothetical protein
MPGRRPLTQWPQAIVEEVGLLLVAHWKTANSLTERAGRAVQWASSSRPLTRYMDALLSTHPFSTSKR